METFSDSNTDNNDYIVDTPDISDSTEPEIDTVDSPLVSETPESDVFQRLDAVMTGSGDSDYTLYMDVDCFNDIMYNTVPYCFSVGFALSTILVLLTYGAFKALSFIRIKY